RWPTCVRTDLLRTVAIAPKSVERRNPRLRPGVNCAFVRGVSIDPKQLQSDRGAAKRLRRCNAVMRVEASRVMRFGRVDEHDESVRDAQMDMEARAIGTRETIELLRAKRPLIEFRRAGSIMDNQVWNRAADRDFRSFDGHCCFPLRL